MTSRYYLYHHKLIGSNTGRPTLKKDEPLFETRIDKASRVVKHAAILWSEVQAKCVVSAFGVKIVIIARLGSVVANGEGVERIVFERLKNYRLR